MNRNYYCVIMAGGVGVRFWPLSRTSRPKQFIDILGTGETLIQQTFHRLQSICPTENIYIVTHQNYRTLVKEQLPLISDDQILCEPARRNTAPCIAYACYKISKINPDAKVVVAPSDHIILKENVFNEVVHTALEAASHNNWLLTLGVTPSRPDTGYGYIQFDDSKSYSPSGLVRKVKTFTEKPQIELAVSFLQSGDFLWNSGIFVWSVKSIIAAFSRHLPEVDSVFSEGMPYFSTQGESEFINNAYSLCKSISIDYGVMEKADNVYVIAADFGWSDLGTWGSLYESLPHTYDQNAVIGNKTLLFDTQNTIINLPHDKIAVIQGLDGYIVVEDDNTLLICKRKDEQKIRSYVDAVNQITPTTTK
jgi:mannose-1-phosphate guanylyltransferase